MEKQKEKGSNILSQKNLRQAWSLFNAICFPVKILLLISHDSAGMLSSQADVKSASRF